MKEFLGSLDLSLSFAAHAAEALNWHVAYASVVAFLLVRHFDSNLRKHDAIALQLQCGFGQGVRSIQGCSTTLLCAIGALKLS